jgi:hypothetical protein
MRWTSGLDPCGSVVTSLMRRPATSGPVGALGAASVRRRGAARRGDGEVLVVVVAAGRIAAEAVFVVDGVVVVVDRGVVVD